VVKQQSKTNKQMKRFLISMAALLAVVGCAKQEDLVSGDFGFADGPEFEVGFESSRVSIAEDGEGFKLTWNEGDLISCFLSTGGNAKYIYDGESGSDFGIIKPLEVPAGDLLSAFYAAYPYAEGNALADGKLSITLPAEQTYAEGTFGPNSNTMVAVNANKEPFYTFSNMCGYVRLKVWGEATITSIVFQGNKEENIAGAALADAAAKSLNITGEGKTITVNCNEGVTLGASEAEATEFWVVVPPMTFDEGFTVTLIDAEGKKMTKKLGTAFTVKRNTVHEGKIAYEADNDILFDAKFNLDGTATDAGKYNMTIERKVDGDGKTPYMTTVADAASPTGVAVAFTRPVSTSNGHYTDSYYLVNYADNAEFRAALNDGFTMEVVAKKMVHSYGDWMKPVYSNTFGINYFATAQGNKISINGCDNDDVSSWVLDNKEVMTPAGDIVPELEQYYHYVYVYNKDEGKTILYVDGVKIAEPEDVVTSGTRLAIGGYPHAESIQHAFIGTIAVVRILNNPITAEEVKASYEAMNIKKPAATNAVLFDAKFSADGGATNVGTESSLVITPKLGATATTIQRGDTYVATFNNVPKHNQPVSEGYYYIDYSQNESFKNKLKDGFTMEVLSRTIPYAGNYWSKPFAATTFYPHHDWTVDNSKWGFAVNTAENSWGNAGAFGAWFWYDQVSLNYYDHVVLTYDGGGHFSLYVNGKQNGPYLTATAFAPGSAFAIGALPYNNGSAAHPFVGDVAVTRIYDDVMTPEKVSARYNELQPTISALNTVSYEDRLDVLVDVQFNADGSATDKANGYTITKETVGTGGNLTVANGIATFGIDDKNLTYYKIDLAQGNGSLKTSMNNGFTVATIVSSPNNNTAWAAPFGGEGFSMIRLAGYGYKWNSHIWEPNDKWRYTDGVIAPVANKYYHVMFTYNATTQEWIVFRDGVIDMKATPQMHAMRENSTLVIGARNDSGTICQPWGGNMYSLKVYEQAVGTEKAVELYEAAKADISKAEILTNTKLIDVQFNNDGTATDMVKGYTITKETIGEGGTLVVNNGIVTLGDSDDNMSYYKIDLTQGDGALKTSMNNGFTVEAIVSSPNTNGGWAGAFGGEGFSLFRLAGVYGCKWNINGWNTGNSWKYTDGTIAPVANQYYHILYSYNAQTGQMDVYRDGVLDTKNANFNFKMRENSTVVIGARMDGGKVFQSWLGNIASFAIYEKSADVAEYAAIRYSQVKATVDALNAK
jgi:hypothetical protein